jgi:hypothetical protein
VLLSLLTNNVSVGVSVDMKTIRGQSFTGQRVLLDGKAYSECQFNQCTLVIEGKNLFEMDNCNISDDCKFAVEGAGRVTLHTLKLMLHGGGWLTQVAANVLEHVRQPPQGLENPKPQS